MRSTRAITTGIVFLLYGVSAPLAAQQSQEPKPKQEPQGQTPRRPANDKPVTPQGLQSREPQAERRRVEDKDQGEEWRRHRAHTWRYEHHDWRERGGYSGFRIPEDRFRAAFGRDHLFRIHRMPMVIVRGFPRFQYGGYWIQLIDPWPESWSDDWYENDDVYIDFVDDGYYLYNRHYPDSRLAVRVYSEE